MILNCVVRVVHGARVPLFIMIGLFLTTAIKWLRVGAQNRIGQVPIIKHIFFWPYREHHWNIYKSQIGYASTMQDLISTPLNSEYFLGKKFGCLYRESLKRDWSGPPLRSVSGPPLMKIPRSATVRWSNPGIISHVFYTIIYCSFSNNLKYFKYNIDNSFFYFSWLDNISGWLSN